MKKDDLLLVIDMQNAYLAGEQWACLDTIGVAERISSIINKKQIDVAFSKFLAPQSPIGVWENYNIQYKDINENQYLNELVEPLKKYIEKYPVYEKSVYSSLGNKEILEKCKKAKRVVISGVVAECCVLSTVMQLIDEGIYIIYLTDGVSGLDVQKEKATELILSGLEPLHLKMMTINEYLQENGE